MWSAKLLSSLFSTASRHSQRRGKRRLAVEPLEPRTLMAYSIVDLGTLSAASLNDAGQVAGWATGGRAAVWQSGVVTDLGTLGGANSYAYGINDAGQVGGKANLANGASHAFLWDAASGMQDLGALNGVATTAFAINDFGQVVGSALDKATTARAFLSDSTHGMQDLGTFGGTNSRARAINDVGQVAGWRETRVQTMYSTLIESHGFVWDSSSGATMILGALAGDTGSQAIDINDAGLVIGTSGLVYSAPYGGRYEPRQGFLWDDGVMTGLGFLTPSAINNTGQVVGDRFLWEDGALTDLNTQIDSSLGWVITTTKDINNLGQILGTGTLHGQTRSFLLSPSSVPLPPSLSISDVTVTEGNSVGTSAVFTISLDRPTTEQVTVQFSTVDGTAIAGSDYQAALGSLTFLPGEVVRNITIPVSGDFRDEPNETFFVNLASPTNASLADSQGIATIVDNDLPPTLGINDVTVVEGNSGISYAVFTVMLSAATDKTISLNYATSNGSASAGSDYQSAAGSLTFKPGETVKTISIAIYGEKKKEKDETFYLNLLGSFNGDDLNPADMLGICTIKNDDR